MAPASRGNLAEPPAGFIAERDEGRRCAGRAAMTAWNFLRGGLWRLPTPRRFRLLRSLLHGASYPSSLTTGTPSAFARRRRVGTEGFVRCPASRSARRHAKHARCNLERSKFSERDELCNEGNVGIKPRRYFLERQKRLGPHTCSRPRGAGWEIRTSAPAPVVVVSGAGHGRGWLECGRLVDLHAVERPAKLGEVVSGATREME